MTTAIIPVLAALTLGGSFDLVTYQKGNADIFDRKKIEGDIQVIDRSFTRSQYKLVETSTEAREFLDISGEISLRLKTGNVSVDGSGTYLTESANRQKFVELLIRVEHETITETIPSYLKPKLDWMTKPPDQIGTHYVRSITYGGELIASLRLKAKNREERETIKAAVAANLQLTGTFDLSANGSFDKLRKDLAGMYNVQITLTATTAISSTPETVEELMNIVAEYPDKIKAIDSGKGKAIKAELYPLSSLKADYPNYLPNSALSSLLNDVERKYDDIRTASREVIEWSKENYDFTDEENLQVGELFEEISRVQTIFHTVINHLDASINGKVDQFAEAFKAYGTGNENIPNRFQRWFWRLKHTLGKEPFVWEKPPGSGAVFINWGSDKCASGSISNPDVELLYVGRASGPLAKAWGGGRNYECMKDTDPSLSKPLTPLPKAAYLDAVDFRTFTDPDKSQPIVCAACLVKKTVAVQTFYGKTSCPKNWRIEYSGIAMADSPSNVDADFMCLNKAAYDKMPTDSSGSHVSKINPVWMSCKNCNGDKVVPCTVCSHENKTPVF